MWALAYKRVEKQAIVYFVHLRFIVRESIMVFPLQSSAIRDQRHVMRFYAELDFDQTHCWFSNAEFCIEKTLMSSHALLLQLDETQNCLLISYFMRGSLRMRTITPCSPVLSLDVLSQGVIFKFQPV